MIGEIPIPGSFAIGGLGDAITRNEQLGHTQLTALKADDGSSPPRNIGTFVARTQPIGELITVAAGATSAGKKLFSAQVYVLGNLTSVDVYRLPITS